MKYAPAKSSLEYIIQLLLGFELKLTLNLQKSEVKNLLGV